METPKDLKEQLKKYKLAWNDKGFAFDNEFVTWNSINRVYFSFRLLDNLDHRSFIIIPNLTGRVVVNYSDNKIFKDIIAVNQGFIKKLIERVSKEKIDEDINKFLFEEGLENQCFKNKLRKLKSFSYLINLFIGSAFMIVGYLLSNLLL